MKIIILFAFIFFFIFCRKNITTDINKYGSWHPEINNQHRPRLLLLASEKEIVQHRLSNGIFQNLYNNDFKNRYGSRISGIYQLAGRSALKRQNWKVTAARSRIAKNAAFVYLINRDENGRDPLPVSIREARRDTVIKYLRELDPTVRKCWSDYGDVQWRGKELLYYCQAYDLLMGDPDSIILSFQEKMESKIHDFAANLFYVVDKWKEPWFPFVTTKNNKRIIAAAALGVAALTIGHRGSDQKARQSNGNSRKWRPDSWIGAAMNTIYYLLRTDCEQSLVTKDGAFKEGPHYMRYVANVVFPFIIAMKNFQTLLGRENPWIEKYYNFGKSWEAGHELENPFTNPMFQTIYDYYTAIRQPEGRLPAIKDSYTDAYFPEMAFLAGIKSYYSWPYNSFIPTWDNEALLNSALATDNGADSRVDYICAGNLPTNEGLPQNWKYRSFTSAGSYVYRSNWNFDAFYFHLHGENKPWGNTSHYQEDASSFILNLSGHVLAMDPGYIKSPRSDEVNKAENHNVILVSGNQLNPTQKYYFQKGIDDERYFLFKLSDRKKILKSNRIRSIIGIKVPNHPYVIIYDECKYASEKEFEFLLHGNGNINNNTFGINTSEGTAWWKHQGKTLKTYSKSLPEGIYKHSLATHETGYNRTDMHSVYQHIVRSKKAKYITLLDAFTSEPMTVRDISESGSGYKSYLINSSEKSPNFELVMVSKDNTIKTIPRHSIDAIYQEKIETDAEMLMLSIPKEFSDPKEIKLITQNATFVNYGKIKFQPDESEGVCYNFSIKE